MPLSQEDLLHYCAVMRCLHSLVLVINEVINTCPGPSDNGNVKVTCSNTLISPLVWLNPPKCQNITWITYKVDIAAIFPV